MKKIKWGITLFGIMSILLIMNACENEKAPTGMNDTDIIRTFPKRAETEQILADLASVLPEALTDQELAKLVWNEAKANEADEAYALWSRLADKRTPTGITLRSKIQDIRLKRKQAKTIVDAQAFTSALDQINYLQVYIYAFELWDGETSLPVAFEPITQNDIDVTELLLYYSNGSQATISATEPTDFSIAIVGHHEGHISNSVAPKIMAGYRTETMDKIYLTNDYEPWWKGKAEIYVVSAGTKNQYDMKELDDLTWVNHDGAWYQTDQILFHWDEDTWGDYVGFGVMEEDGLGRNYSVNITSENLHVKVSATGNDDLVGRTTSFTFDHDSYFYDNFGSVKWYLMHLAGI